jgi:succinyl-CoA synthetase alpha subunit
MGHAGAIIGGEDDTAGAKKRIIAECGIAVSETPADMAITLLRHMGKA